MLDVCLSVKWGPTRPGRNASSCWSKEEARSAQTCHTPYIAYKLRVLHTFCGICLACQFLKVFWLLQLLLLLLRCLAYVVDFCHSATGKKCKGQRKGGEGMVCTKREMHKNLLRFILAHAKDAPSCHSQQQQQQQQLFQRAAVVTALVSWWRCPLPLHTSRRICQFIYGAACGCGRTALSI